jgi:hypothetical protein
MSTNETITTLNEPFLRKVSKQGARLFVLMAVLTAVSVVAGIWIDWRWLATAVLPAALSFLSAGLSVTASNELVRRTAMNKDHIR